MKKRVCMVSHDFMVFLVSHEFWQKVLHNCRKSSFGGWATPKKRRSGPSGDRNVVSGVVFLSADIFRACWDIYFRANAHDWKERAFALSSGILKGNSPTPPPPEQRYDFQRLPMGYDLIRVLPGALAGGLVVVVHAAVGRLVLSPSGAARGRRRLLWSSGHRRWWSRHARTGAGGSRHASAAP